MIAQGGKRVYGAPIGILMLEARFPRIPGDMGNALTWPFPVLYHVVPGASPDLVVRRGAAGMLEPFVEAGRALIRQGAEAIATNCGFLALFQAELARALAVPVATSALMQVPAVQALLPPGCRVGVLTVSAASLTAEHLARAGCPADTPVIGTEGGAEFSRVLLEDCLFIPMKVIDFTLDEITRHRETLIGIAAELGLEDLATLLLDTKSESEGRKAKLAEAEAVAARAKQAQKNALEALNNHRQSPPNFATVMAEIKDPIRTAFEFPQRLARWNTRLAQLQAAHAGSHAALVRS